MEAIECYNKVLRINPNNEDVLNNKGISLYNLGKYDDALYCFDRILVINPNAGQVLKNKADVLTKLERHADAQKCYERARKLGIRTD
jgi:tetratricopeptide (TPR) repeat protein